MHPDEAARPACLIAVAGASYPLLKTAPVFRSVYGTDDAPLNTDRQSPSGMKRHQYSLTSTRMEIRFGNTGPKSAPGGQKPTLTSSSSALTKIST